MVELFQVVWKDARGGANIGWRSLSDLMESQVATVVSCGVLLVNDDEKIIICPHVIVEGKNIVEGDAELVIPKQWVVSINKLEKVKCQE